jgi:hypothetical protein
MAILKIALLELAFGIGIGSIIIWLVWPYIKISSSDLRQGNSTEREDDRIF